MTDTHTHSRKGGRREEGCTYHTGTRGATREQREHRGGNAAGTTAQDADITARECAGTSESAPARSADCRADDVRSARAPRPCAHGKHRLWKLWRVMDLRLVEHRQRAR